MKGAAFKWGALVLFFCGLAGPALAGDVNVSDRDRSFRNFTRDTATVGNGRIRLEVRGFSLEDNLYVELNIAGLPIEKVQQDLTNPPTGYPSAREPPCRAVSLDLLGELWPSADKAEIGLDVPYFIETIARRRRQFGQQVLEEQPRCGRHDPVRQVQAPGGRALRTGAMGMELSLPTGNRKEVLRYRSSVSTRSSPRVTSAVAWVGEIHVGYQIYTGDEFKDVLNWSGVVYARGSEHYLLRVEISGGATSTPSAGQAQRCRASCRASISS